MAVPADLNTIDNPTTGQPIPAAWGDQVRTWIEFMASPPRCSVSNSAAQSLANGTTLIALTANTEAIDTDSMHSTSSNTSRINCVTAGDYTFIAVVSHAASATGNRALAFRHTTAAAVVTDYLVDLSNGIATNSLGVSGSLVLTLGVGDHVQCMAWQNSGGANDCTLVQFSARWIGRV